MTHSNISSPESRDVEKNITTDDTVTVCENSLQTGEGDCSNVATIKVNEENETVIPSSPTLPKQSSNPDAEPLGK